jgi:hypothetical protein
VISGPFAQGKSLRGTTDPPTALEYDYFVSLEQNWIRRRKAAIAARSRKKQAEVSKGKEGELELELIQTHMTQKSLLWVEVGAHAVRKRSECAGVVWAGAGVAWRLCVCCL